LSFLDYPLLSEKFNGASQFVVDHDGNYLFVVHMDGTNFEAIVDVVVLGKHGHLSIVDWPLLLSYGILCSLYISAGILWLMISIIRWKDFGYPRKLSFLCRVSTHK
jgi:hypothetical protein